MIARDIVVDAVRLNAMRKNVVVAANIFGKLKTVFQMVAIILIMVNDFNLDSLLHLNDNYYLGQLFMYVATLTSLISGIIYVIQNRNVFSEMK